MGGVIEGGRGGAGAGAANLKALSMELGGKSPCVVFADADLEAALDSALFGVMSLNGERCTAGSRILVERTVYGSFLARLSERAARVRVGDAADTATEIGAVVHPEHYTGDRAGAERRSDRWCGWLHRCLGVTRLPPNGDRQRNKRA